MKNHKKWIFWSTAVLITAVVTGVSKPAFAEVEGPSEDDRLLEQRVMQELPKSVNNRTTYARPFSMVQSLNQVRTFKKAAKDKSPRCVDAQKKIFANKYVLTTDENGNPCRVYDLSFPTLKTLFAARKTLQVPVQKMVSRDYLNWMDGNYVAIDQSQQRFRREFNPQLAARNSWVSRLKFRQRPVAVPGSASIYNPQGLPQSFRVSDLDIGSQFDFSATARTEIDALTAELQTLAVDSQERVGLGQLLQIAKKPESLLKGIKFNWNSMEKVYDVAIEGDFLPISGPVVLVDYQTQYKYTVEKILRTVLSEGLSQLARLIPTPMVASAVEVLVTDVFEQVEFAYAYQMRQLEETLRQTGSTRGPVGVDAVMAVRAMNLLYGQRADLLSNYVLSVAQGKTFDWQAFEAIGKTARYSSEKQRDIMMDQSNSRLVLEKQCQNTFVDDYFALCTRAGQKDAMYSLISQQSLFSKNMGASLIYRYQRPYEVTLKRGGTWLLSMALRIVGLPMSRQVTNRLDDALKAYMHAGLLDEALLRNNLTSDVKNGRRMNVEDTNMVKWLYIQNLNPFLPKTAEGEQRMIEANKMLLGMN